MDIKELASIAFDRAQSHKNLVESQLARLTFAHDGAIWLINTDLFCLLQTYQHHSEVVLLDANNIPRKVKPLQLLDIATAKHQEIMNDWLVEYAKLAKIRSAKDVN